MCLIEAKEQDKHSFSTILLSAKLENNSYWYLNFRRNSKFEQYILRLCVDSFSWAIINYREHCLLFISCESYSPHPRLYVYIPLLPLGGRAELDQNFDSIEICPEVWWVLEKKCVSHFLEKPQNKTYLLWPGACKGLWVKKTPGNYLQSIAGTPLSSSFVSWKRGSSGWLGSHWNVWLLGFWLAQ